jgi:hypothetical protein
MNVQYKAMFLSRVAAAIGAAKAAAEITHPGVKGRIREILVGDLFRPMLPTDVGVGTGQIITFDGDISTEQDIVIYDRRILPPALFGEGGLGLFPIECVLATVEVKTTLTLAELRSSHESAAAISRFKYLPGEREANTDRLVPHDIRNAIATVLALNTDLSGTGKSEIDRYQELSPGPDPPLKAICVSGGGYWYFQEGKWKHHDVDGQHKETCAFVVGLFDTFSIVRVSRHQPNLAGYLL